MSDKTKINIASYRCFQTLKFLFDKSLTMNELVEILEQDGFGSFNNFVASKYINTCKSCGIDIQKIDGKYTLINFPFGLRFTPEESELIFEIKQASEIMKSRNIEHNIQKLIDKLHLAYFKSSMGIKSSKNYKIIKLFEKASVAESKINLVYFSGETVLCEPVELFVKDEKVYFKIKIDSKNEIINPDEIMDVKLTDEKVRKTKLESNDVIFELTGKLAKRYQPRENEQIIKFKRNGNIVVSNKYEDSKTLLHRLMRYDSLCKVLKPQECVDEMKNMIQKTLDNYAE